MSKRSLRACVMLSLMAAAGVGSRVEARPPDLPVDTTVTCTPMIQTTGEEPSEPRCCKPCEYPADVARYVAELLDSFLARFPYPLECYPVPDGGTVYPHCPQRIAVPMLGPVGMPVDVGFPVVRDPNDRQKLYEFFVKLFKDPTPPDDPEGDPHKLAQARTMYLIGQRCLVNGDDDMARNCFEETKLIYPNCRYARLAAEQLQRMDIARRLDGTEGAGEPQEAVQKQPPQKKRAVVKPRRAIRETDADLRRLAEARFLFATAERARLAGDLDTAYRCYQEAHLACPECRYGQKAIERMAQIDQERARKTEIGIGEEQEPPRKKKAAPAKPKMEELLFQSEDLRQLQDECRTIWFADQPSHLTYQRVHGGIGPCDPCDVELEVSLPLLDWLIAPVFTRLAEEIAAAGKGLGIEVEVNGPEEQEPPVRPCGKPVSLFVPATARNLTVRQEKQEGVAQTPEHDLSDWLCDTLRRIDYTVSLRVEAHRLGRLMAEGEEAVRRLGCGVVHEPCGRCYVVYPPPRE